MNEIEESNNKDTLLATLNSMLIKHIERTDSIQRLLFNRAQAKELFYMNGTQNQAVLTFRSDSTFEVFWTGILFANLYQGTYKIIDGHFLLNYRQEKPNGMTSVLKRTPGGLVCVPESDSDQQIYVQFYVGDNLSPY